MPTRLGIPLVPNACFVWERGVGSVQIVAAPITSLLPSSRLPNPQATNPNWTFYDATGCYLAAGFRDFWNQSGGLPVFGYPLTEEFDELNPASGQAVTVQHFERERFEYHPELAGTPYAIELGRLGAEEAAREGLLSTQPFLPLPSTTRSGGQCSFFALTGHQVCGDFRPFWQSHGLDMGDPGISSRESLALFGYPISRPFIDPATGLLTQYFDRAVFEEHSQAPASGRVELRRWGAVALAARGW